MLFGSKNKRNSDTYDNPGEHREDRPTPHTGELFHPHSVNKRQRHRDGKKGCGPTLDWAWLYAFRGTATNR